MELSEKFTNIIKGTDNYSLTGNKSCKNCSVRLVPITEYDSKNFLTLPTDNEKTLICPRCGERSIFNQSSESVEIQLKAAFPVKKSEVGFIQQEKEEKNLLVKSKPRRMPSSFVHKDSKPQNVDSKTGENRVNQTMIDFLKARRLNLKEIVTFYE